MASDPEIILNGILKLGLDLDKGTDKLLIGKLKKIADSGLADVDLLNIEKSLQDLTKLESRVAKARTALSQRALTPEAPISRAQERQLRKQTAELQAYLELLRKTKAAINALGKVDLSPRGEEGQPLPRKKGERIPRESFVKETAQFNALINELSAILAKAKPLTTSASQELARSESARRAEEVAAKRRTAALEKKQREAEVRAQRKAAKNDTEALAGRTALRDSVRVQTPVGVRGRDVQLGADLSSEGARAANRSRLRADLTASKKKQAAEQLAITRALLKDQETMEKDINDRQLRERDERAKAVLALEKAKNDELGKQLRARIRDQEVMEKDLFDRQLRQRDERERALSVLEKAKNDELGKQLRARQRVLEQQAEFERKSQLQQRNLIAKAYDQAEKEDRARARRVSDARVKLDEQESLRRRQAQIARQKADADFAFKQQQLDTTKASGRASLQQGRQQGFDTLDLGQTREARDYARRQQGLLEGRRSSLSGIAGAAKDTEAAGRAAASAAKDVAALDARLNQLGATSEKAGGKMHGLSLTFQAFLRYALGYGALYQVLAGFTALARGVVDLDTELRNIQAVTNATDKEMSDLSNTIGQVATQTKFSVTEIAKATQVLAQAGIAADGMQTALSATANFASATGTSLQDAADLISTTRDIFKDLDDTTLADQLAKAVNISKLTGEGLKTILSLAGQTAEQFGLSSEQFLGAVGTLRNAGLKDSTVATGLRQGMLEVFSPDNTLVKALQNRYRALGEEMGDAAIRARFQAFTKGDNPLLSAATELQRLGFNGEGAADFARAFDVRAINALQALIANIDDFAGSTTAITFGQSAAEGAATSMRSLSSSVENLGSNIGLLTAERSEGFVGWLASVADGASEAVQRVRELQQARDAGVEAPKSTGSLGARIGAGLDLAARSSPLAVAGRISSAEIGFGRDLITGGRFSREKEAAEATTQAKEGARLQATLQSRVQQYLDAAKAFDVDAAELGNSVGKTAAQIVKMQGASKSLNSALERTFGETGEEVEAAVREYASLAPSLRPKLLEKLKEQFPDLNNLPPSEADGTIFNLSKRLKEVDDGLKAYTTELDREFRQAQEVIQRMGDRAPETPEELRAVLLDQQFAVDEELQRIIAGTSEASAEVQLAAVRRMSQAIANGNKQMAEGMQGGTINAIDQLIKEIRRITLNRKEGTRGPEIKAAVSAFLQGLKDVDDRTIQQLREAATRLSDAAGSAPAGERGDLQTTSGLLDSEAVSREGKLREAQAARVNTARNSINPTLQSRDFLDWLRNQLPEGGTDFDTVTAAATRRDRLTGAFIGVPGSQAQSNSPEFQTVDRWTTAYREVQEQADKLSKIHDEDIRRRLAADEELSDAQQARQQAETDRDFGKLSAAIERERQAERAVVEMRLEEARDKERGSLGDPNAYKQNRDAVLREEAKLNNIDEQAAKRQGQAARQRSQSGLDSEARKLKRQVGELGDAIEGALAVGDVDKAKQLGAEQDTLNQKLLANQKEQLDLVSKHNPAMQEEYDQLEKSTRKWADILENELSVIESLAAQRDKKITEAETRFAESRNPAETARFETFGAPLTREERLRRLQQDQQVATARIGSTRATLEGYNATLAKGEPTAPADKKEYEAAKVAAVGLRQELVRLRQEQAFLNAEIARTGATWMSSFDDGLDIDVLVSKLQSATYSIENLGQALQDNLVSAFDAIGDAAVNALIKQESFTDSLKASLSGVAEEYLSLLVKTGINSLATGALRLFSPDKDKGDTTKSSGASALLGQVLGVGGEPGSSPDNPLYVKNADGAGGAGAGAEAVEQGPIGQFIGGLKDKFFGMFGELGETLKGAFSPILQGLSALFSGGSSGSKNSAAAGAALQIAGLFLGGSKPGGGGGGGTTISGTAGMRVARSGGLIGSAGDVLRAATGGIMRGPGSGTSDSLRGFVVDRKGRRQPIATSSGEGILNARAVNNLGEGFVHAANAGRLHSARAAVGSGQSEVAAAASRSPAAKMAATPAPAPVTVDGSLHISNVLDSGSMVAAGVKSPAGRRAYMNFIKDNRDEIRQIVR